jgi:hypothetical protein
MVSPVTVRLVLLLLALSAGALAARPPFPEARPRTGRKDLLPWRRDARP